MQPETKEKQALSKYSLEEYAAIRNEIVSMMEQSRNIWITMITLYEDDLMDVFAEYKKSIRRK